MCDLPDPTARALTAQLRAARDEVEQLKLAVLARHEIGIAQGMLMLRYGITVEAAFEYLIRRSQDENVKLRDIARGVAAELARTPWPGGPSDS